MVVVVSSGCRATGTESGLTLTLFKEAGELLIPHGSTDRESIEKLIRLLTDLSEEARVLSALF